jgi:hypothetical protein
MPAVSRHLKVLECAALIWRRDDGEHPTVLRVEPV